MVYSSQVIEMAKELLQSRRARAEAENARRLKEFEESNPEYKALKQEMIDSVREVVAAVGTDKESMKKILLAQRERNLSAQDGIKRLLKKSGLPEDYLEVNYTCKKCSDTGIDAQANVCSCFTDALRQAAFNEAGKKSPLKFSSFEDFRLDYYTDQKNPDFGCSAKERAGEILSLCKAYAEDFDLSSQNLLMVGETGLGKTHLSLAIAGEAIKKGYKVLYNSAQNIFNELQKEYFGRTDSRGQFEALVLESDLLILDDLGAEFSTQFTDAALYNIINTRINTSLPTIISTNLPLRELENRYSRRISSRLIGEYLLLRFFGNDVRQVKSEQKG
ncbi:MAG: ATP-binding protein [Oscillospiraceae bacterium]|nr:ATP-binding protein [Oscillospiraceae bacterium]